MPLTSSLLLLVLSATLSGTPVLAQSPNLHVTLGETAVTVHGATPEGAVLLIGFQRSTRGYETVFRRIERTIQAGVDGRAELILPPGPSSDALFVAVDLRSGAFGSAVPRGKPPRRKPLPAAALIKGQHGRFESIDTQGDYVYIVVIRPGAGAFAATAGDGAPSDTDGQANGRVRVAAANLRQPRQSSGLPDLQSGDLVLVFPAHRMTFLAGVVQP